VREGRQGLLEQGGGLAMGRACKRLCPRLAEIRDGSAPDLPPKGMVSEAVNVLGETVGVPGLDGLHDPRMEVAPSL
jgi:hypothetical protein